MTLWVTSGVVLGVLLCTFNPFHTATMAFTELEQEHIEPEKLNTFDAIILNNTIDQPNQTLFKTQNVDDGRLVLNKRNELSLLHFQDRCELRVELIGESGYSQRRYFFKDTQLISAQKSIFYYHNRGLTKTRAMYGDGIETYSHEVFNPHSERIIYEFESTLRHIPEIYLKQCHQLAQLNSTAY